MAFDKRGHYRLHGMWRDRMMLCLLCCACSLPQGLAEGGVDRDGGSLGSGGGSGEVSAGGGTGGSTGGSSGGVGGSSGTGGSIGTGGSGGTSGSFAPGPSGCTPIQLDANVNLANYRSDRYGWSDAKCQRRTAALVRNDAVDPGGSRGGYLREFTLMRGSTLTTLRGTGVNGWNGWGYVVNHTENGGDESSRHLGTWRTVFTGPHHAIHEFKVRMSLGGPVDATVRWVFATGRDHPLYAIQYDATAAGTNGVKADSRAPYGDIAFEGTLGAIGGVAWGDKYRFITTGKGPLTFASAWDYTAANTVPFTRMWSQTADAEAGLVQTETFEQKVGGGDYGVGVLGSACWNKTSSTKGANCSAANQTMPQSWLWPFQLNQYELPFENTSHRLAWGTSFGAVGQTKYTAFGKSLSGYPTFGYAVFMVFGGKESSAVMKQVTEMEHQTGAVFSASVGTGASWEPQVAAYLVKAAAGKAAVTLDPKAGSVTSPVFHVTGFNSTAPKVTLNGAPLAASSYFASVDAAASELWLTLNGTVTGPVTVHVE